MSIEEYFGTKFLRSKFSALDGRTTVTYEEQASDSDKASGISPGDPFTIKCTPAGMTFHGRLHKEISNMSELQDWARLVSKCWAEHERLAPKLHKTLSGH
jgi:hypothetical protein